jgi:hypothetical protein
MLCCSPSLLVLRAERGSSAAKPRARPPSPSVSSLVLHLPNILRGAAACSVAHLASSSSARSAGPLRGSAVPSSWTLHLLPRPKPLMYPPRHRRRPPPPKISPKTSPGPPKFPQPRGEAAGLLLSASLLDPLLLQPQSYLYLTSIHLFFALAAKPRASASPAQPRASSWLSSASLLGLSLP